MKGLHGGFPLAVLAASATAHAQGKVIGSSSGGDVGSAASIPNINTASTSVNEEYTDDHSFDFKNNVNIDIDAGHGYGHWKRVAGHPDAAVIGGAGGVDVGNSADIPTLNSFSSGVREDYKDDHSVDIDSKTVIKPASPPHPHFWPHHDRRDGHKASGKTTVLGGPSGGDVGNSVDKPTVNTASSAVNEEYKDDHSFDFDSKTDIKVPPPPTFWPHYPRRDGEPEKKTVVGGASGVDVGNSADVPTVNSASSEVKESYKDDHSFDFDSKTDIEVPPPPTFWPHYPRRDGVPEKKTVVGGPGAVDVGNTASLPTVNKFSASYTGKYSDDHSVDVDGSFVVKPASGDRHGPEHPALGFHHAMHHARTGPATVIGGSGGVDVGNTADIPTLNSFTSSVAQSYKDDHSFDLDSDFIVKGGHKARAVRPAHDDDDDDFDDFDDDDDTTLIGGPSGIDIGNIADIPTVNTFDSQTDESYKDDHSVKVNTDTVIDYPQPHPPHFEGHGGPPPSKPHDDWHPEPPAPVKPSEPEHEWHPEPPAPVKPSEAHHEWHSKAPAPTEPSKPHDEWHSEPPAPTEPSKPHGDWHPEPPAPVKPSEPEHEWHPEPPAPVKPSEAHHEWHSKAPAPTEPSKPHDEWHPEPSAPVRPSEPEHEWHSEPAAATEPSKPHDEWDPEPSSTAESECTTDKEAVQTVTRTKTAIATETVAWQHDSHDEPEEPSDKYPPADTAGEDDEQEQAPAEPEYTGEENIGNYPSAGTPENNEEEQQKESEPQYPSSQEGNSSDPSTGTPTSDEAEEQAPAAPQYPSEESNNKYPSPGTPKTTHEEDQAPADPQYPSSADDSSDSWNSPSPGGSSSQDETDASNETSEYPANSEVVHGNQASAAPEPVATPHESSQVVAAGPSPTGANAYAYPSAQYAYPSAPPALDYTAPPVPYANPAGPAGYQNPSAQPALAYPSAPGQGANPSAPAPYSAPYAQPGYAYAGSAPGAQNPYGYPASAPGAQNPYGYPASAPGIQNPYAGVSSFEVIPVFVPTGTPRAHASVVIVSSSTPIPSSAYDGAAPTGASAEENERASSSPSSHGPVAFTGSAGRVAPFAGVATVLAGVFAVVAFAL